MDMRTALDTAVKAANQFPMTVGNIRDALGYATEAAVQSGQSLEETLLVIGSLMPITKTASKAGTVYRNAALSLVKPESQKILSELGVAAVDAEGKRRPLMDMFLDLNDQLEEVAKGKASKYYRSPEFIAAEKARAKAEGRKYEPKSLDKVFKQQLGLEREQLEFKLTGVRGGSIFAAVNRLVETTSDKLRGTAFEGMKADTARTAFEFLRISMSNAAGEAARLAGELRRTSKTLGDSFDASFERFKIALGNFALPAKAAVLTISKTILDNISERLTPDPGLGKEYTPGSSILLNTGGVLGGTLGAGFIAYQAVQFGKAIFQAKGLISSMAAEAAKVAAAKAAETAAVAGTAVAAGGLRTAFGSVLGFLTGPWMLALAAGAAVLFSFRTGVQSAYKAVTDFSDYLDRQNKSRTQREDRALGSLFEALAAGKLKLGDKGQLVGLNRGQAFDIAEGGPLIAAIARDLAAGGDPTLVGKRLFDARRKVIEKQYKDRPELEEQRRMLKEDEQRFRDDLEPKLLRNLFTSPNYMSDKKQVGTFNSQQLLNAYQVTQLNRAVRGYAPYAKEFPVGGAEVALNKEFMNQQDAATMEEAMSKASWWKRLSYKIKLAEIPLEERLRPTSEAEINALVQTKRETLGQYAYGVGGNFLTPEEEQILKDYEVQLRNKPVTLTKASQIDTEGRYMAAITPEAQYKNPAIDSFLSVVGEGPKSLNRMPGLIDAITNFLEKAATEKGQRDLGAIISQISFPPSTPMPSVVLEPEQNK
jgi:hypothetical protein